MKTDDRRHKPKEKVFFVAVEGEALAFPAAEIREKRKLETTLGGSAVTVEWDAALRAPRGYRQVVAARQEIPVLPIYWFAVLRHFPNGVRSGFPARVSAWQIIDACHPERSEGSRTRHASKAIEHGIPVASLLGMTARSRQPAETVRVDADTTWALPNALQQPASRRPGRP